MDTFVYKPKEAKLPAGNDGTTFDGTVKTEVGTLLPIPLQAGSKKN